MALHKTRPLADIRVIRVIYGKIASAISNQSSAINNQSSVISHQLCDLGALARKNIQEEDGCREKTILIGIKVVTLKLFDYHIRLTSTRNWLIPMKRVLQLKFPLFIK